MIPAIERLSTRFRTFMEQTSPSTTIEQNARLKHGPRSGILFELKRSGKTCLTAEELSEIIVLNHKEFDNTSIARLTPEQVLLSAEAFPYTEVRDGLVCLKPLQKPDNINARPLASQ